MTSVDGASECVSTWICAAHSCWCSFGGHNSKQAAMVWACVARERWWLGEEMYGVWSVGPGPREDQRGPGEMLWKRTVQHVNWTRTMLRILLQVDRGRLMIRTGVSQWICSVTANLGSHVQRAVKRLCVCVDTGWSFRCWVLIFETTVLSVSTFMPALFDLNLKP